MNKRSAVSRFPGTGLVLSALCIFASALFLAACSEPPRTDLRTFVPAESLVYLETNDLAAALQPVIDSKPMSELVATKADLSMLRGVQMAVAVTGFVASEEKINETQSVGRIRPRFVAVVDTHKWNYQVEQFVEQKLGSFVETIYNSEPKLDKGTKNSGSYFKWTAEDGRTAFALVVNGIIYFGNDETAIDKCLAAKRGEIDSVAKLNKVPQIDEKVLAAGYVSTDGVAQIANVISLQFAGEASDEAEVQSALAGILPQIIRGTITDVSWSQHESAAGIEDTYQVGTPPDIATAFSEAMKPSGSDDQGLAGSLRGDIQTATSYDLKDPLTAWNTIVDRLKNILDPRSKMMADLIVPVLFEAYGIEKPSDFLASAGPIIRTESGGKDGDQHMVAAMVKDHDRLIAALANPQKGKAEDGDLAVRSSDGLVEFGSPELIAQIDAQPTDEDRFKSMLTVSKTATVRTISVSADDTAKVCDLLTTCIDKKKASAISLTETSFNRSGVERRTISDLGLIGWIIGQLVEE